MKSRDHKKKKKKRNLQNWRKLEKNKKMQREINVLAVTYLLLGLCAFLKFLAI